MLYLVSLDYRTAASDVITALTFAFSGNNAALSAVLPAMLWLIRIAILAVFSYLAITDARTMRLPNKGNGALFLLSITHLAILVLSAEAGIAVVTPSSAAPVQDLPMTTGRQWMIGGLPADWQSVAAWTTVADWQGVAIWTLLGMAALAVPLLFADLIHPGSFGAGDIKLAAAVGPLLGPVNTLTGGMYGLLLAGIVGAGMMLLKKKGRQDAIPLGPFLIAGFLAAWVPTW